MQSLPKLTTPGGDFVLPLADQTAARLAVALLAEGDPQARQRVLVEALADDPALVVWTLCRAGGDVVFSRSEPNDLVPLADWWAENLAEALDSASRPADAASAAPITAAADPRRMVWAELAARSLATAVLAQRIAEQHRLPAHQAYLLGLLHAAPRWLAHGTCPGPAPQHSAALPAWLQSALCEMHSRTPRSPATAVDCVALALEWIEGKTGKPVDAELLDRAQLGTQLSATRRRWLQSAGTDLLGPLVSRLARLKTLEEQFAATLEHEKLESLKELAYGAGHEINNPLANISARAQTLLQNEHDPDRRRMLGSIHTQAMRAYEMIADMMLFARPPQPVLATVDLADVVRQTCGELEAAAAEQGTQLVAHLPDNPVTVRADRTQLGVALRAVCVNSLEALVSGGKVDVILAARPELGPIAQLTVSDDGPGITPVAAAHLFDPFYSGREAGRGLGFGLSKAWRIIDLHGGRIVVSDSGGPGATFSIVLPLLKNG